MLLTMKALLKFSFSTVFILTFLFACDDAGKNDGFVKEKGYALGTTYNISYETVTDSVSYKNEIENIFDQVNQSISTYLPTSDISRINKGDSTIIVDKHFKAVFNKSKEIWQNSDGFFDPTVGALVNAWGFGPEAGLKNISQKQLDSILVFTGFDKVELDENNRVIKQHPNVYLDFNALAKGYTIDLIGAFLESKNIKNYCIEIGSEVLTKGPKAAFTRNWLVAIESPTATTSEKTSVAKIQLLNTAYAASGNYRKFRVDETTGEHFVHTIDPKTGQPQRSNVLSTSVIANTCMDADGYATALMVMPLEEAKQLLKKLNTVEAFIISADRDGDLQEYKTKGFQQLLEDENTTEN